MSYRDMTFCGFHLDCERNHKRPCHRALTVEVALKADALGIPVARFVDPPECFRKPFSTNGESAENNE